MFNQLVSVGGSFVCGFLDVFFLTFAEQYAFNTESFELSTPSSTWRATCRSFGGLLCTATAAASVE
jgi:hypothetical protein